MQGSSLHRDALHAVRGDTQKTCPRHSTLLGGGLADRSTGVEEKMETTTTESQMEYGMEARILQAEWKPFQSSRDY